MSDDLKLPPPAPTRVIITDVDIRFGSMVGLILKFWMANLLIYAMVMAIGAAIFVVTSLLGAILVGMNI